MYSNPCARAMVICTTLATLAVVMFSGSSTLLQNFVMPHFKSSRFTGGHKEAFVYSTTQIWNTIKGIQQKNCRTLETLDDSENCQKLRKCNGARTSLDLPPTCRHRLPGCLIIGVFKAGTRELIDFLSMHPDIVIKRYPIYEISFFSSGKWSRGFEWYRKQMPLSMGHQITIEKSPDYFTNEQAPKRIWQMNPYVKLILIVRDPVERAISHFTFQNPNRNATFAINDGKKMTKRQAVIL